MNNNSRKFANHVTALAFNLSLSKNMIIALAGIAGTVDRWNRDIYVAFGGFDTVVTSCRSLEERGLIYAPDKEYPGIYKLTDAGQHVFKLLEIAGLVKKVAAANEQITAEKAVQS